MDITPQDTTLQPISDDQELAKALAGVLPDEPEKPADASLESDMQFEEIHVPTPVTPPAAAPDPIAADPAPVADDNAALENAIADLPSAPEASVAPAPVSGDAPSSDLETIKNQALHDLRPLIDRVDLPAEEKFDTYLMLLRSTDDSTLISPAYAVAQSITDETRKAEALLDIIKEIDYVSHKDSGETPAV